MPKVISKAVITREEEAQFAEFLKRRGSDIQDKLVKGHNRSTSNTAARDSLFLDRFEEILSKFEGKYVVGKALPPSKTKVSDKAISVNLSDLHYGAALDKREVPLAYTHVEEARRTAAVALWIAEHRSLAERQNMDLYVNLIGDIIQGQLHDPRDGNPMAEQVCASIHLLSQFIAYVSASGYRKVIVNCTPGNHGRNTMRHQERATSQKWDAIETMVYYAVMKATKHIKNVSFSIPYTPFFTYEVFGHKVFATHGDTVLKPGYPNKSINVGDVRRQINEINADLEQHEKYKVFIVGHVHVSSKTKLPNGVYFMSNGCLIPTDGFAQSIGITDSATCQTVFESTPSHPVGFHCEIDVGPQHDKDKALDKVISPFSDISL